MYKRITKISLGAVCGKIARTVLWRGMSSNGHLYSRNDRKFNQQNFVTSGGVLFWNLEIVPKFHIIADARIQPPVSNTLMQAVDALLDLKHRSHEMSLFSTEEQVFGELLPAQAYFFPTTFNCRSDYMRVASDILRAEQVSSENDTQILKSIVSGDVLIWHWDYEKKPWTYNPSIALELPETTWWSYFNEFFDPQRSEKYISELMRFFASVGNLAMVQRYAQQNQDDCIDVAIRHGHFGVAHALKAQDTTEI